MYLHGVCRTRTEFIVTRVRITCPVSRFAHDAWHSHRLEISSIPLPTQPADELYRKESVCMCFPGRREIVSLTVSFPIEKRDLVSAWLVGRRCAWQTSSSGRQNLSYHPCQCKLCYVKNCINIKRVTQISEVLLVCLHIFAFGLLERDQSILIYIFLCVITHIGTLPVGGVR